MADVKAESPGFDPACRLICLATLSSASLLSRWPLAAVVAVGAAAPLARRYLRPAALLKELSFVLAFAILSGALRLLASEWGISDMPALASVTALYGLKLAAAFLAGRLFYAATRASELRDASTRIARRLPLLRRVDIGLLFALVLGFLPLILEEWRSSLEAARSRGMTRRPGIRTQAAFVSAFLRRLLLRAVALPEALQARGWALNRGLSPSSWGTRDGFAVAICVLAFVAAALGLV